MTAVPPHGLTHVLAISTHPTSGLACENCTSSEAASSVTEGLTGFQLTHDGQRVEQMFGFVVVVVVVL